MIDLKVWIENRSNNSAQYFCDLNDIPYDDSDVIPDLFQDDFYDHDMVYLGYSLYIAALDNVVSLILRHPNYTGYSELWSYTFTSENWSLTGIKLVELMSAIRRAIS